MPIKEIKHNIEDRVVDFFSFTSQSEIKNTIPFDTADFSQGVTFIPIVTATTTLSDIDLVSVQESETFGGQYVGVPSENIVGDLANFQNMDPLAFDAPVLLPTFGVIGVKRFIRLTFQVSAETPPNLTLLVLANDRPNVVPSDSF